MTSYNNKIIKNPTRDTNSKIYISPNIYEVYTIQNNIAREIKSEDDLIKMIRTKKFRMRRKEILKFKNIGEMLIVRAKKEASKILNESMENAQIEIVRAKVSSKVQGYKEGFEEGKAKAISEIESQKSALISDAVEFYENTKQEAREYIKSKEDEIKNLIFGMVSKIIKRQLNDSDILNNIIYDCIKNIKDSSPVVIKCSEFNYKFVKEQVSKWKDQSGIFGDFHVVISKDIEKGNFLIERNGGIIKYNIEDNLDMIKEIIFKKDV